MDYFVANARLTEMSTRPHHGVQLHRVRYHGSTGHELPRFSLLDWAACSSLRELSYHTNEFRSWSLVLHWLLAIANSCNMLTYVTRFSCDIFGFYVAFIYLQKGIEVLTRQWGSSGETSAYLAIMVALLVLMFSYLCHALGQSTLFRHEIRKFIEDYGTPLTLVFFTGFVHIGHMRSVQVETLPTSKAFFPTVDRSWLVDFWNVSVGDIFLALPFAVLLTILFYFDHNGKGNPTL